jgi:hypothetical protein
MATDTTTIDTLSELLSANDKAIVPMGFVISGTVKLFGLFEEEMYSYNGNAPNSVRRIVMLGTGDYCHI